MRPATRDTLTSTRRRVRNATVATAVGLALIVGGGVAGRAQQNGAGGTSVKAGPAVQRGGVGVVPSRRATGTALDINLSRQWATLYKGGQVVASFPISSGKRGWRTPTGTYRVYRRLWGWHRSRLGLMWNPAYFRGGYAVHGSRSVPRYPASHGCVRVPMGRMAWLTGQLPIGSTVRLHY
jgi:lipoprotein-anchoring transpeptidase ErfK/SrfK